VHPAESGRIERLSALRLYSLGSAWLSNEDDRKGTIEVEKFADLAVLSADYFTIPEEADRISTHPCGGQG
jgi:predicted amidohydrolase YtcJ